MTTADPTALGIDADADLYEILGVSKDATLQDIKRAYRRQALRYHPDKQPIDATPEARTEATIAFQRLGFVYAVLSDEKRRARYDRTGEFTDILDLEEGADWDTYFNELFDRVNDEKLEKFAAEYRNSEEELTDLLTAYQQHKGDMDLIFKDMPIVNVLDDEERLKERLRKEIELGHIPAYRAFTHEPKSKQRARQKRALKEAKEAAQIHAQLSKQQTAKTENDLAIMIQQRNKKRMDSLIAGLEEKYAPRSKKASNKTRTGRKKSVKKSTEPSEEEFAALQAKLFGNTSSN